MLFCLSLAAFFWCTTLLLDRMALNENIIRLHVVANSDEEADQNRKLMVRDAVIAGIQKDLAGIADMNAAKEYLRVNLPRIKEIAEQALEQAGFSGDVAVSLCEEAFATRVYDTFSLPAGVYDALRITIGKGEGKNWWCVVFPSLCVPATVEDFENVAAGAGFSECLYKTMTKESGYKLRFYLLEKMGELETLFFAE